MPNWVFSSVVVSGDKLELDKLKEQLNQPVTKHYPDHTYNKETEQWEDTPAIQQYSNPVFSFWNVIAPTDLDAYYGREKHTIDPDNIMGSIIEGFALGMDSYNWNVRNWGTKWDIGVLDGEQYPDTTLEVVDDGSLMYRFHTAWSPVPQIFEELSKQFPTLSFDYEYEEETGWGGSETWEDGECLEREHYDTPLSHADYEKLSRECPCEYEDIEYAFEDCPVDTNKYEFLNGEWIEKEGVEA